jgi:hypothetical protein
LSRTEARSHRRTRREGNERRRWRGKDRARVAEMPQRLIL